MSKSAEQRVATDQVAVFFTRDEIQALAKQARPKNGFPSAEELALQQDAWKRILKAESVDRNAQAKAAGK
ncbi:MULTISPECIES: hypothetical protein [unclassified Pseudoclavibacter]|uniref:hypothetical protein n=1 Tax=unclassified Pseudoclavibacter TaxID=2615177 RepID=UPI001BAE1EB0|nr:hypothetical protein [Pseudoclavibacter sp. Marseille-Q4354]MBS3177719.1 hypothetical protein [Pseudoclavibacter sp. Marseille-Q4354]